MRKTHIAIATTIVLTVGLTEAYAADGNFLLETCQSGSSIPTSYISGVVDTVLTTPGTLVGFCAPRAATMKQLRDITCDWLERHPALRHQVGSQLVVRALRETFPCQ